MRVSRTVFVVVLVGCLAWSSTEVRCDPPSAPRATKVVVRGKQDLGEALAAATRPAWADGQARPVLLVFDVTPYTKKGRTAIEQALVDVAGKAGAVPTWSVAALGGKPSKAVTSPSALGTALGKALRDETDVVSTLTSLSKTLKSWRKKGGVVVYLADWHFEDDVDLEKFIEGLQRKGRTLSVVGTEAAFRRGWNDGLRDLGERIYEDRRGLQMEDYWEGVGRDPFGGKNKRAPWHGGDTAYPYAPYRWDFLTWETSFSQSDWDIADLGDEADDLLDESPEREALRTESDAIDEALERVERELAAGPDDDRRRELEAERDRLEEESKRVNLELLKTYGGGLAETAEGMLRVDQLEQERDAVKAELSEILFQIVQSEDEVECARLEAKQRELEAEVARISKEIESLEAASKEGYPGSEPDLPDLPGGIEDPEELRGRLPGGGKDPEGAKTPEWIDTKDRYREFPLPSSYGPYGLMRAAGVTGGRYVLFSWNPSGRKTVLYEYTRCNLFPPDLRSRKEIRADLKDNAWARGMLEAWCVVTDARTEVLEQLPPLLKNLRSPCSMDRCPYTEVSSRCWDSHGQKKAFLRLTKRAIEVIDQAAKCLDAALQSAGSPEDDVEQRYEAEALVFRHALRVARFEMSESLAAAAEVPRSAWREKEREPGVGTRLWIRPSRRSDPIRTWGDVALYDPAAGQVILEERKLLLERFRGTPLGEEVAMNDVDSAEPDWWERAKSVPDTGRGSSQSTDIPKPTPKPPGSGSGGGGPSTGGG